LHPLETGESFVVTDMAFEQLVAAAGLARRGRKSSSAKDERWEIIMARAAGRISRRSGPGEFLQTPPKLSGA